MSSENPTGADNQQETVRPRLELDPRWITGFVDGEGCFCVSVHRNPTCARRTGGWQLHPTFQVYQHRRHRAVLEAIAAAFGCGRIRPKGPNSSVLTYSVDTLSQLEELILPFFEHHPLVVKAHDFNLFSDIVRAMRRKEHLYPDGFERLTRLAYAMNADGKQRARDIDSVLAWILRDCTPGSPAGVMRD